MTMELNGPRSDVRWRKQRRLVRRDARTAGIRDRVLRDANDSRGPRHAGAPRVHAAPKLATPRWAEPRARVRWEETRVTRQLLAGSDSLAFVACCLIGLKLGLNLLIPAAAVWLVLMLRDDLRGCRGEVCGPRRALVVGAIASSVLGVSALLFRPPPEASAQLGLLALALASVGAAGLRLAVRRAPLPALRAAQRPESILLVGDRRRVEETMDAWARAGDTGRVVGVCLTSDPEDDTGMTEHIRDVPVFIGLDDATEAVQRTRADLVAVLPHAGVTDAALRKLSWSLERTGADLSVITPLLDVAGHRVMPTVVGRQLLVRVTHTSPARVHAAARSVGDRLLATSLLALTAPLLAMVALAVRLDSPGPAMFRQQRVREGGRLFTMLKFRTMHVDAEEGKAALTPLSDHGNGVLFKMRNDPRVTRVGRLLRASSLDELPQLINVLRGEMALVGPRPALPDEVSRYEEMAHRRLAVKPGLTGLWQVSGRANLSWEESVRLDLHYVDNWRHAVDLGILVRTVKAVLRRDGAC